MRTRLSRLIRDIDIALVAGLVSLVENLYLVRARAINEVSIGLPFPITYEIPGCVSPAGPRACLAYDPLQLGLDFLFWTGLTLVIVIFIDWTTTFAAARAKKRRSQLEKTSRLNP